MVKSQVIGARESWACVGEHISEAFVRGYAGLIRPLSPKVADDLLNIAEHSNRLAVENKELWRRAKPVSQCRIEYFLANWPR